MKNLIITFGLLCYCYLAFSQTIDYNKIILPDNASNVEFEEKLVQLAWKNHPSNKILFSNLSIAAQETKIASAEWANLFRASGNLNEFNINRDGDGSNQFYPRYNFGVSIPFGTFTVIPSQVRRSRDKERIAQYSIDTQKLVVRSSVLKLYNEYLMFKEIFNLRSQELEEATSNFLLVEQRFKSGEEQYEKYTQGIANLNRVKIDRMQAQTDYLNSKISLEELIGIKLEDVK